MPPLRDPAVLRELQGEIETFLKSLRHPIVVEDEVEFFDLTAAEWRLTIDFGKLIFTAWNAARSVTRRVEELAYRDSGRLGVFVRKPGRRETCTLEFRELQSRQGGTPLPPGRDRGAGPPERAERARERARFRQQLLAMLARAYPGWAFERVSNRSDREHSFSTWYTRGWARQGRTAWAFLGLSDVESPPAADAALAFGLIWLDWLRSRSERVVVPGLKLIVPSDAVSLIAHRAACVNPRAVQLELLEWRPGQKSTTPVDVRDYGNVETRLVPRRQGEILVDGHRDLLGNLLGDLFSGIEVVPGSTGSFLSLRVLGLEVARVEGQLAPQIFFGLEGSMRRLDPAERDHPEKFRQFLATVLHARQARSPDPSSVFYRLQSERWLESLIVRDVTKIDPALAPPCVYPQVPAFSGTDRGIIDILLATRRGRLVVMELKVEEEINLPFQALDYWLRVKWLQERNQFREFGYFPGVELAPAPPLLYLVSPAFRYHSTTNRLLHYLHPSITVIQVGINNSWRQGLRVLFRREMRATVSGLGIRD